MVHEAPVSRFVTPACVYMILCEMIAGSPSRYEYGGLKLIRVEVALKLIPEMRSMRSCILFLTLNSAPPLTSFTTPEMSIMRRFSTSTENPKPGNFSE